MATSLHRGRRGILPFPQQSRTTESNNVDPSLAPCARSRVFLIAQPTVPAHGKMPDLSPLREYGELRVLVQAGEYPKFRPTEAMKLIAGRMKDFDPKQDYLVWVGGDTLSAVMTGFLLSELSYTYEFTRIRWLRFDRGSDPVSGRRSVDPKHGARYVPIWVPLAEPVNDPNQMDLFEESDTK